MNEAYNKLTKPQQMYVDSIRTIGEGWGYDLTKTNWTRKELTAVSMLRQKNDDVPNWIVKDKARRVGRGVYSIPEIADASPGTVQVKTQIGSPIPTDVAPGQEIEGDGLGDTVITPVPKFIEDDPQSDEILQAVKELNL